MAPPPMRSAERPPPPPPRKPIEQMQPDEFDQLYATTELDADTTCGYWMCKGWLQTLASKKMYVLLYGLVNMLLGATYAYFNATISTMEKRYRIPSRNTGIITTGNDISSVFVSSILSYYGGKSNRPQWMAMGLMALVIFCFMNAMPHWLYGAGSDALQLTVEREADFRGSNSTEFLENEKRKVLCTANRGGGAAQCDTGDGDLATQVILFAAQLISGIGQTLVYTLGSTYMDDNIQKSKSATYLSLSFFMRLIGPTFGYTMASYFLQLYIDPTLTPTITTKDPRWLGAWWVGWLVLGFGLALAMPCLAMFPKSLPRAAVRRIIQKERLRRELSTHSNGEEASSAGDKVEKASLSDMLATFKRLLNNRTYMCNTMSAVFFVFGYIPYWTFTSKYLETQYHVSASQASLVTGTVAFAFSALGILLAGAVVTRTKPAARSMVTWNVIVGSVTVAGMLTYSALGCPVNAHGAVVINTPGGLEALRATTGQVLDEAAASSATACNANCSCDYVKYSPVCGEDGRTYISACHAGCQDELVINDKKIFTQCACVQPNRTSSLYDIYSSNATSKGQETFIASIAPPRESLSIAIAGPCPIDCYNYFVSFLVVMAVLKFIGATGRATGFLVAVRCVDERDKSASLGLNVMIIGTLALVPSPIFFGQLMDMNCLVWGKTCTGAGNCWLYNSDSLRYSLNTIAASCVFVSVLFELAVWYYAKDLKMYDDDDNNGDGAKASAKRNSKRNGNAIRSASADAGDGLNETDAMVAKSAAATTTTTPDVCK